LTPDALRYAAFTAGADGRAPEGGNPAGVVLDASGLSADEMQAIAAEVGYSETAFLTPAEGAPREYTARYYSPLAEVPFCGHATIAAAVALGTPGELLFHTRNGPVAVSSAAGRATLTSVEPRVADLAAEDLDELLAALGWAHDDLDPGLPPRVAYAGVHHPVIAAATRKRLAALDYDFERLGRLMAARDWTTVQLVWRESPGLFHARDPFPPGGLMEDPATGAAAAAFGAYLRELGLVTPPATVTLLQGEDMGHPSRLEVAIPPGCGGIDVTGAAVEIASRG
jgi:PhzF family phenazine biosynthesis protein